MDALREWMKTDLDLITVGKSPFRKRALLPPHPPAPPRPSLSAGPGFSWPDKAKSVGSVTQPLPTILQLDAVRAYSARGGHLPRWHSLL